MIGYRLEGRNMPSDCALLDPLLPNAKSTETSEGQTQAYIILTPA